MPLGGPRARQRNPLLSIELIACRSSGSQRTAEPRAEAVQARALAGRGGAGRGHYISRRRSTRNRDSQSKTRCPGAGCLAGAAEAAFLAQSEKGALIGQRDPAVVGRKESRRLIGRAAPAMRQAAVGVEGFRVNGCGPRGRRPPREGAAAPVAAIFTRGGTGAPVSLGFLTAPLGR